MRRIVLWALSTLSCLVLLFGYSTSTSSQLPTTAPTSIESHLTTGSPGSSGSSSGSGGSTSSGITTVTGSVASTQWGPVQVRLTVAGDTITDVAVVEYPHGNSRDLEINGYALPILTKETVDAQGAGIDMVSGATVTSRGYLQSLQSALDSAGL